MQYIILNDISNCLKNKRIIICYIICLMIFCTFGVLTDVSFLKYKALGLILTNDFIEILMYILNILFYIYLIVYIFIFDIKYNIDNLFVRFFKTQYIIYKLISIFIIITITKTIFHILLSFNSNFNLIILIKDIFSYLIVSLLFLNILLNLKSILLILLLIFTVKLTDIINTNLFLLILTLTVLILILIYNKRFLFKLHERMK